MPVSISEVGWGTSNNATTTSTSVFDDLAQFFPGTTPSGSTAGANSGSAALKQSGPIGGGQIGYNWQFAPLWVLGFEADIQGAAITSDGAGNSGTSTESFAGTSTFSKSVTHQPSAEKLVATFTNPAISASGFDSVTANLNWLGTVRARLGYLVTPNLLLYATGGLAYAGVSASDSPTTNFNLTADSFALAYGQAITSSSPPLSRFPLLPGPLRPPLRPRFRLMPPTTSSQR
jgi:opacity protein-like surface antigen